MGPEFLRLRRFLSLAVCCCLSAAGQGPESFKFVILGDRTGEAQAGVYERVWHDAAAEKPAFVVSVGDTIQGYRDATAAVEWQQWKRIVEPYQDIPLYLAAGNHDVWSPLSEGLFRQFAGHPTHYSFDYGPAHFTVLDNSRTDALRAGELAFLDEDLKAHSSAPMKFVVSHRPSWLVPMIVGNPDFELQRIVKKYGAQFVIAGHLHEMLHGAVDGVDYVSVVSSGGALRASRKYEDGWFFGYVVVEVSRRQVQFHIHELMAPFGLGRVSDLKQWGKSGLM
jgi:Icc protein